MHDVGRFTYRDHLVRLVARCEAAAARLALGDPDRIADLARRARPAAARASVRLDASPLDDATAEDVDAGKAPGAASLEPPVGGWASALRLEGMATQEVAALEYANALRCLEAEADLAEAFQQDPTAALARAHGLLIDGLVDPEAQGRLRTVGIDVHDGAQGQVIFRGPDPERLPGLIAALASWLAERSAEKPGMVVAGVVHARLLEWQPYVAANGRLARLAARLVLRRRGLDPHGVAAAEPALAADPMGYHREIAAEVRRRGDLTDWLERYGEALADDLERAADAAQGLGGPRPAARALAAVADLEPGEAVTLPGYATAVGVDRQTARGDLETLRRAGLLRAEAGTRGLRLRRTAEPPA